MSERLRELVEAYGRWGLAKRWIWWILPHPHAYRHVSSMMYGYYRMRLYDCTRCGRDFEAWNRNPREAS